MKLCSPVVILAKARIQTKSVLVSGFPIWSGMTINAQRKWVNV